MNCSIIEKIQHFHLGENMLKLLAALYGTICCLNLRVETTFFPLCSVSITTPASSQVSKTKANKIFSIEPRKFGLQAVTKAE